MAKAANVELLQAEATCPGKFVILITGELSAVRASVDRAAVAYEDKVIDTFVLGNPHESIFPAIYGTAEPKDINALGVLETYDVAAMIEAADTGVAMANAHPQVLAAADLVTSSNDEDGVARTLRELGVS